MFAQDLSLLADNSNLIHFTQLISFDPLVNSQRIAEFSSSRIEFGDCSLASQVKLQITLWQWQSTANLSREWLETSLFRTNTHLQGQQANHGCHRIAKANWTNATHRHQVLCNARLGAFIQRHSTFAHTWNDKPPWWPDKTTRQGTAWKACEVHHGSLWLNLTICFNSAIVAVAQGTWESEEWWTCHEFKIKINQNRWSLTKISLWVKHQERPSQVFTWTKPPSTKSACSGACERRNSKTVESLQNSTLFNTWLN